MTGIPSRPTEGVSMGAALDSTPPPKRRARTRKSAPSRREKDTKDASAAKAHPGRRWLKLIPALAFSMLALLSVLSFDPKDAGAWSAGRATHNWIGPVGHGLAWALFHAFGVSAYGVVAAILTVTGLALARNLRRLAPLASFGWMLTGSATSALAYLVANPAHWNYPPGGALGRAIGDAARGAFSLTGSLILLSLPAFHGDPARDPLRRRSRVPGDRRARRVGQVSVTAARSAYAAYDRRRRARLMRAEADEQEQEDEAFEAGDDGRYPLTAELVLGHDDEYEDEEEEPEPVKAVAIKPVAVKSSPKALKDEPVISTPPQSLPPRVILPDVPPDSLAPAAKKKERKPKVEKEEEPISEISPAAEAVTEPPPAAAVSRPPHGPAIVEPRPPPKPFKQTEFQMTAGTTGFHLPTTDQILEGETHTTRKIDHAALTATAEKLRQKLIDLGVVGEVTEIRPGPVVTMYEFKPAAGIKLSRIASLSDDLAMAMEALRVRIVAPIPGKGVVGFEVPNRTREMVFLKEVVEQEAFQKGGSRLTMAVGKDIEGLPYVADLAKMPHLLIAGTTGSGKSVGVNSMLVSMLMRATPEELRFIMVDPKMLELSIYEGIPHLLLPVVTDPKKAALALRWGVEEMERRYTLLAEAGVRNVAGYNKYLERAALEKLKLAAVDGQATEDNEAEAPKKLPYIVIIIDELADLMMVASREVETYIARLAQMARAAGIHLMVATQRPSTDVVTGVIKANFPTRISFQVASRHDSATIINTPGAENLLGMGDMLIVPPGTSSLTRVHGALRQRASRSTASPTSGSHRALRSLTRKSCVRAATKTGR